MEPRHHDVNRLVERLFDGIDFAWAAASLVESMPVPGRPPPGGKPPTGWRRLALAARERLRALSDEGSVTADRDGCRGDPSAAARGVDQGVEAPTVWFQAGSFGDLKPPFVRLLEQSVLGEMDGEDTRDTRDEEETQWSDVLRTRCLWPSRAMALSMRFSSLSNLRFMPMAKYDEIPEEVRDRLFFDGRCVQVLTTTPRLLPHRCAIASSSTRSRPHSVAPPPQPAYPSPTQRSHSSPAEPWPAEPWRTARHAGRAAYFTWAHTT